MSFTYDPNGNLTSDGSLSYAWNARNQLSGLSGSTTAAFLYDGMGRRRAKTIAGASREFLHDNWNPVQELSGGVATANLLTGLGIDEYLMRTESTASLYLSDGLLNTIALTDATGAVQTTYTYEAFGAATASGSATSNPFTFTGRELDVGSLLHFRLRAYDNRLRRFISEDPLVVAGGTNLHLFVRNRPTGLFDPFGLKPSDVRPAHWARAAGTPSGAPANTRTSSYGARSEAPVQFAV